MNLEQIIEGDMYSYTKYPNPPRLVRCLGNFGDYVSVIVEDGTSKSNGVQMNLDENEAKNFLSEIIK